MFRSSTRNCISLPQHSHKRQYPTLCVFPRGESNECLRGNFDALRNIDHFRTLAIQQLCNIKLVVEDCTSKRGSAIIVALIHLCSSLDQHLTKGIMSAATN